MLLSRLDHLVLTTRDIDACVDFYTRILGMRLETFAGTRLALHFGQHKINLHQAGAELSPHAAHPVPGSLDLCLLLAIPLTAAMLHLEEMSWPVESGPIRRTGAESPLLSIYLRDPDGNLIELSEPQ
jgi:catechol 2,3-dioxygenase-like lactoylglutathione lyase family enzyme